MTAQLDGRFAIATVRAAQRGDRQALQDLLSEGLPLIYNIVGCALQGHADVDDVVQETMLRAVRGLGDLRDPGAYRSWLVAVAIRQVRDHLRARQAALARTMPLEEVDTVADPAGDFAEATVLQLGLSGQRREVAEAARWMDSGYRELLALWWMETAGELRRADLADTLGVPSSHVAVRIQRMKQQLTAARVVVRALNSSARCSDLSALSLEWDGTQNPLWRKRLVNHTRDCAVCAEQSQDLIPAERLLVGLPLVAPPVGAAAVWLRAAHNASAATGSTGGASSAGGSSTSAGLPAKAAAVLTAKTGAVIAAIGVTAGGVGFAVTQHGHSAPAAASLPQVVSTSTTAPPSPTPVPATSAAKTSAAVPATAPATSHSSALKAVAPLPPPASKTNVKKGVAAWSAPDFDQALTASKASWYYDWSPSRIDHLTGQGPEFVPMVWGPKNVDSATLSLVAKQGTELLTFNEPDMGAQSNMTVDQALALWPQLQATGLRLGSPAVATGAATPGGWLDQFMKGAAAKGYRVDFITVHWYGSDFHTGPAVAQLQSYLQAIHDRYHLPIWLTEYALINFGGGQQYPSTAQQAAFVTSSASMLSSLPYVERFAWFGLAASGAQTGTALFQGPTATPMGLAFEGS